LLATLNEDYDEILNSIERTGQIKRENLQLEERIEHETSNKMEEKIERVKQDLLLMQKENSRLEKQLKL